MQQQLILPEGGLASFLTSNIDELDDSQLAFGRQSGINSHTDVAERMAGLGRNGDTELVHAEKGEIVIHPKLLAENPRLAKEMMDAFTNSDVDLSRYIIGSRSNSINPDTGQAEFFWKQIKRGLKKLVGGIKKIVKKFAPIIVPLVVGAFTGGMGLGLMGQGALAGGITSLVQGGNFKDAMKGALIGGVIGGVTAGAKGAYMSSSGNRFKGFGKGFMQSAPKSFGGGGLKFGEITGIEAAGVEELYQHPPSFKDRLDVDPAKRGYKGPNQLKTSYKKPSFMSQAKGLLKKPMPSLKEVKTQLLTGPNAKVYQALTDADLTAKARIVLEGTTPGLSWLKTGAAIGGGALAAGAFDPIEPTPLEDPYDSPSPSETRLAKYPGRYRSGVAAAPSAVTMQDTMVPANSQMMYQKYLNQQQQPQFAAAGGEMRDFPRRTGYIGGSGTETSDDIPAMLSDGEFVMNAKAVRGAGNGSRKEGVRKMYDIMRAFEGGAVA
jgi:hypothetical protein